MKIETQQTQIATLEKSVGIVERAALVAAFAGLGYGFYWIAKKILVGPPIIIVNYPCPPGDHPTPTELGPDTGPTGTKGGGTPPLTTWTQDQLNTAADLANSDPDPQRSINACYYYLKGLLPHPTPEQLASGYNFCAGSNRFLGRVTGGGRGPGGGVGGRGGRG